MKKKNIIVVIAALSVCAALAITARMGGEERREMSELCSESSLKSLDDAESTLKKYQDKLKEQPNSEILKYNLARFHFRRENYEESGKIFEELINSETLDKSAAQKTFYNLGNVFFRLAEKEKDLNKAVSSLNKSLGYYRAAIEMEGRGEEYFDPKKEKSDARFNYAAARGKLKLLEDELEKQKQTRERQKRLYQLLKEMFAEEKKVKERLAVLKGRSLSGESLKKRGLLLSSRKNNLKKLKIIQDKIDQYLGSSTLPPKRPLNN